MAHNISVKKMWNEYHESIGAQAPAEIIADSFSDRPEEATELSILVSQGIKQATASSLWAIDKMGSEIPVVGGVFLVMDGQREAVCIVKTMKVSIIPYSEITEAHAYTEGEGDRSLEHWRRVHIEYYKRQFEPLGLTFDETMPIVFEELAKVFPVDHARSL